VNPKLAERFQLLETQRLSLLAGLQEKTGTEINQTRTPKWSIAQIAGHLITAERLSISYIDKKINAINEVGNTNFWNEVKLVVFIISQRLPLKYKAPKNLGDLPKSYADVESLVKDWNEVRQELEILLQRFSEENLKKKIYRHPILGRCSVLHALTFFREHIIHHNPQIERQLLRQT